jgi:hypothetical protein
MQRETAPRAAVLHFWDMLNLLTSEHESVEAAVAEAYAFAASDTALPERITATDGTVLMDSQALAEAMVRYGEGCRFRWRTADGRPNAVGAGRDLHHAGHRHRHRCGGRIRVGRVTAAGFQVLFSGRP